MAEHTSTTPWRTLSTAIYKAPTDSRIYGSIDIDVTNTMDYIREMRRQGTKVTLTHFVTAAIARTFNEDVPDINGFVRRGQVILRDDIEAFISVAVERGKGMSGVIIPEAQKSPASQIAAQLREKVSEIRSGLDSGVGGSKDILAKIPWPFRRPLFLFIKWWIYDMGLHLPFLNIPSRPFGSFILSEIGSHGLTTGMAALFPIGKVPVVFVLGKAKDKPVVKRGEIVIRSMATLTATMDHRIIDGAHAGLLAYGIKRRMRNPEKLNTALE